MIFPPSKNKPVQSSGKLQSLVGYFSRMTAGSLLGSFHLPVNIQTNDGLSWSDDGKLAVATKKGVYVFEITPDAKSTRNHINFVKTFVENDDAVNPWQLEYVLTEEELTELPRSVRSEVMLDRIICPHMATGDTAFRQPNKVQCTGDSVHSVQGTVYRGQGTVFK